MAMNPQRVPALLALLAHLAALLATYGLLQACAALGVRPGMMTVALVEGLVAAWLGQWWGLSVWWLPINLFFVPALLAFQGRPLPAWLPLAGFFLALSLNWNSFGERVPLYLTGRRTRRRLAELLASRAPGFAFIDLGCGLGGTLAHLARAFPQARFEGVETAPLSFLIAWLRCLPLRNCRVRYRSLWKVDLAAHDVVYCFLSPVPMPALGDKARAEMDDGAWLLSNTFEIPGWPPSERIEVGDLRGSCLLRWRIGEAPHGENPGRAPR